MSFRPKVNSIKPGDRVVLDSFEKAYTRLYGTSPYNHLLGQSRSILGIDRQEYEMDYAHKSFVVDIVYGDHFDVKENDLVFAVHFIKCKSNINIEEYLFEI